MAGYSQFDLRRYQYNLPEELIAQHPCRDRDGAKLLRLSSDGSIEDTHVKRLTDYLNAGDVLVLNNSKVLPMRIFAHKSAASGQRGGRIEILISKIIDERRAQAMLRASRPPKVGSHIVLDIGVDEQDAQIKAGPAGNNISTDNGLEGGGEQLETRQASSSAAGKAADCLLVEDVNEADGGAPTYVLSSDGKSITELCEQYGHTPLPPYIKRADDENDKERYQTVYAKHSEGGSSAAAPTAGLHLSRRLLDEIKSKGVEVCELTLHVGLGTFAPIRSNDIREHKMHSEYCQLPAGIAARLNQAKGDGRLLVAVGTTSLRVLESFYDEQSASFSAGAKDTNIFIYPGSREPRGADLLLTNFHQPASSLLLLVCAFSGYDNIVAAYQHAIKSNYRFLSYGDACLLQRKTEK